jgi:hypothetical protein
MYVRLDKTIIDRGTRIASALNEVRIPVGPSRPPQFPDMTLSTMRNLMAFAKSYWKSYKEQTAPNGIGLGRLRDGAAETLSAIVPIVNFLVWKDERHGVIPLAFWLRKDRSPIVGDNPLSKDERLFVAEVRHLLNLLAELWALTLAQSSEWSDTCPASSFEVDLRRQLTQLAERTCEQAIILLSVSGLDPNPHLEEWRARLARAKQEQAIVLLVDAGSEAYPAVISRMRKLVSDHQA